MVSRQNLRRQNILRQNRHDKTYIEQNLHVDKTKRESIYIYLSFQKDQSDCPIKYVTEIG